MMLSRITKIKGHRVFRDFVWPNELPGFSQFNVIYGWNGSGKTTLSPLLANLQEKRVVSEGTVEFELDNGAMIAWLGVLMHKSGIRMKVEESVIDQRFRTDMVDVSWRD